MDFKDLLHQITSSHWTKWIALFSGVMFVATIVSLPWIVIKIPRDYFKNEDIPARVRPSPWVYWSTLIVRNILGLLLLAAGVLMLFLPGQGLLTILIALLVMEFPGKRKLEMSLVRRPAIFKAINHLRQRWKRPPLEL